MQARTEVKNTTNKAGSEMKQIRMKEQEELKEVRISPGCSDHSSQILLPTPHPSIDLYFNVCITECHLNFSEQCL
jgi:hypothetical protein